MNLRSSEDYYRRLQRIQAVALAGTRRAWRRMDERNLDASFALVAPQLIGLLTAAQIAAADAAVAYVPAAAAEQGIDAPALAEVRPEGFAGAASDGRALIGLLYSAVVYSRIAAANRAPAPLQSGLRFLEMAVPTEVTDAGRSATQVDQYVRPQLTRYVRMLNPPSCARCAILAGRVYKSSGFQRHPNCDCVHVPTNEDVAGDLRTDPRLYFDSLGANQAKRIFGKAGSQAIRDGADMNQIVNANRGMRTVGGQLRTVRFGQQSVRVTNEGITARGFAVNAPGSSVARRQGVRLTPFSIYQIAGYGNRDEAIRLLRANGYIR